MSKERTKVGDIRISKRTKKPIICTGVEYTTTGNEDSTWASYEKNLLKIKMGMSPAALQHFIDMFDANQPIEQIRDVIKIRYAYIDSRDDYKEILFLFPSLDHLEKYGLDKRNIKILGRDLCTGRVDMGGKAIYEGDIIRWFLDSGDYIDETIHRTSHFAELDSTRDCKVIGTIYDKEGI